MFEAIKHNMVPILEKKHSIAKTNVSQVETFGASEAEDRFILDMKMEVGDHSHALKIKVYNTKCSLDAQGLKGEVQKVFEHLGNRTVGEYFVYIVISKIVEYLERNLNIKELNEKYLKLAREGFKTAKKHENTCTNCKTNSPGNVLKCKYCKKTTHESCAKKFLSAETIQTKLNKPGTFQCKECVIQITLNVEPNDEEEVEANDENKMIEAATLIRIDDSPVVVEVTEPVDNQEDSSQGKSQTQFQCDICEFRSDIKDVLKRHVENVHTNVIDIACDFGAT